MNAKIFNESWCQVWYDEEYQAINSKWEGFISIYQLQRSSEIISEYVSSRQVKLHYCNQIKLKVLSRDAQEFLALEWLPKLEQVGLERMAVLMPLDSYAKASMEKVNHSFSSQGKLEFFTFGLEKECLNWLKVNRSQLISTEKVFDKISAFQILKVDEEVKKLDPLHLDEDIFLVRECNENRNVDGLIRLLYSKLPSLQKAKNFDYYEALAAMRDVGLFLGSIKKLGVEPLHAIPELEIFLEELSIKTSLPPRDTLLHYTVWNPDGGRMRCYTNTQDEIALIQSVKNAMPAMEGSIDQLVKLHHMPLESAAFEGLCIMAGVKFKQVIDAIVFAHRTVSPEVFAKELRFYFDPITYGKQTLIGPGAVEMPMFVYDHLLWSSQILDEAYVEFKTTYLPYNMMFMRDIYDHYTGKPSLVDVAIFALSNKPSEQVVKSAKALLKLCNMQKSFRKPHKKLAEESYAHQDESGKDKGSGGYSTDILTFIIELNENQIDRLANAIEKQIVVNV